MAEIIAFNAKGREEEIAGEKAFVTSSGARNVGREFVLTRGRAAETATPEEESIWTTWKAEMRRNLFFGSTLSIIIKEGRTWSTECAPLGVTPTPWTDSSRRGSISPTLRGPY